jgi:hypothetical protein
LARRPPRPLQRLRRADRRVARHLRAGPSIELARALAARAEALIELDEDAIAFSQLDELVDLLSDLEDARAPRLHAAALGRRARLSLRHEDRHPRARADAERAIEVLEAGGLAEPESRELLAELLVLLGRLLALGGDDEAKLPLERAVEVAATLAEPVRRLYLARAHRELAVARAQEEPEAGLAELDLAEAALRGRAARVRPRRRGPHDRLDARGGPRQRGARRRGAGPPRRAAGRRGVGAGPAGRDPRHGRPRRGGDRGRGAAHRAAHGAARPARPRRLPRARRRAPLAGPAPGERRRPRGAGGARRGRPRGVQPAAGPLAPPPVPGPRGPGRGARPGRGPRRAPAPGAHPHRPHPRPRGGDRPGRARAHVAPGRRRAAPPRPGPRRAAQLHVGGRDPRGAGTTRTTRPSWGSSRWPGARSATRSPPATSGSRRATGSTRPWPRSRPSSARRGSRT